MLNLNSHELEITKMYARNFADGYRLMTDAGSYEPNPFEKLLLKNFAADLMESLEENDT